MEGDKMRLQGLLQPLQENDKFITAINSIKNKRFPINISGLSDSGKESDTAAAHPSSEKD